MNEGKKIYELISELFPICRSITGDGVRKSLKIISEFIPLKIHEIPSGTKVFDWTIPKEWNVKDACIKDSNGNRILDFQESNLHLVSYSIPIKKRMPLEKLKKHIHYLQDRPKAIPYLTSYYKEDWGFCMSYDQYKKLKLGMYDIEIDTTLKKGSLTYGEFLIKGKLKDEILLSCYICHPSLCNDNLSGVGLLTFLAMEISKIKTKYSYRFLFIPETIGAIAWLNNNQEKLKRIKCGLVVTCVGDRGEFTYKKTKNGNSAIDFTVERVLKKLKVNHKIIKFFPDGSDERQFSSPGIDLQIGSLMRTMYGEFKEYHTSLDNLDFISSKELQKSYNVYKEIIDELECSTRYISNNQECEPFLAKRKMSVNLGGKIDKSIKKNAILWLMNYSDGNHSIKDISTLSSIKLEYLELVSKFLIKKKLLHKI